MTVNPLSLFSIEQLDPELAARNAQRAREAEIRKARRPILKRQWWPEDYDQIYCRFENTSGEKLFRLLLNCIEWELDLEDEERSEILWLDRDNDNEPFWKKERERLKTEAIRGIDDPELGPSILVLCYGEKPPACGIGNDYVANYDHDPKGVILRVWPFEEWTQSEIDSWPLDPHHADMVEDEGGCGEEIAAVPVEPAKFKPEPCVRCKNAMNCGKSKACAYCETLDRRAYKKVTHQQRRDKASAVCGRGKNLAPHKGNVGVTCKSCLRMNREAMEALEAEKEIEEEKAVEEEPKPKEAPVLKAGPSITHWLHPEKRRAACRPHVNSMPNSDPERVTCTACKKSLNKWERTHKPKAKKKKTMADAVKGQLAKKGIEDVEVVMRDGYAEITVRRNGTVTKTRTRGVQPPAPKCRSGCKNGAEVVKRWSVKARAWTSLCKPCATGTYYGLPAFVEKPLSHSELEGYENAKAQAEAELAEEDSNPFAGYAEDQLTDDDDWS